MQIEWSEAEVLKWVGVGSEAEVEVVEIAGRRIDGEKRRDTGREACGVFELWRSDFMSQL
jgi:hypothetical protein